MQSFSSTNATTWDISCVLSAGGASSMPSEAWRLAYALVRAPCPAPGARGPLFVVWYLISRELREHESCELRELGAWRLAGVALGSQCLRRVSLCVAGAWCQADLR